MAALAADARYDRGLFPAFANGDIPSLLSVNASQMFPAASCLFAPFFPPLLLTIRWLRSFALELLCVYKSLALLLPL